MILKFKSAPFQPTARCAKQSCLIEEGDWIRISGDKLICMFCDNLIREYVRKIEKEIKNDNNIR